MKSIIRPSILFLLIVILGQISFAQKNEQRVLTSSRTWAVIVGISRYQNIAGLKYADKDARAFYDYLVSSKVGPRIAPSQVKMLLNEQATAVEIYRLLDWLKETTRRGDRVIFYFSGHGDVEKNSISKNAFLLANDSPVAAYMTSGTVDVEYVLKYAQSYIAVNKAKNVVLIIDACRSGAFALDERNALMINAALSRIQNKQIIKILSAQANELSIEGPQWGGGRGVFSYYLVKGLTGAADVNRDNIVTTTELATYLQLKLSEATSNKQHPLIDGAAELGIFPVKVNSNQIQNDKSSGFEGLGTGIAEKLPDTIRARYNLYLKLLSRDSVLYNSKGQLLKNSAAQIYTQLIKDPAAQQIYASLKSSFRAALLAPTLRLLVDYLSNQTVTIHSSISQEIMYSRNLVDSNDVLFNYVNSRAYFMESTRHWNQRNVIKYLDSALLFDRKAPFIYNHLGNAYAEIKRPDSAIYFYKKAIDLAPKWVMLYINLGLAYHQKRDFAQEAASYKKALKIDSTNADACNDLGSYYAMTGRYKQALYNNRKAVHYLETKPKFRDSSYTSKFYYDLGVDYEHLQQRDKAAELYLKAIGFDNSKVVYYGALASVCKNREMLDTAMKFQFEALKKDTINAAVFFNIGAIYFAMNPSTPLALKYFRKSLRLDSTQAYTSYFCGMAYLSAGKIDDAYECITRSFRLDSTDIAYRAMAGYCYVAKGQLGKGTNLLRTAMAVNLDNAAIIYNIACGWSIAGDTMNSLLCLKKAIQCGFREYNQIMEDGDLVNLRKLPEFESLIKQYFPTGK